MWAKRKPTIATLAASILVVSLAGLFGILWQWQRVQVERELKSINAARLNEERAASALREAERSFAGGRPVRGLLPLAAALQRTPANRVVVSRLLFALTYPEFALPVVAPLQHEGWVDAVALTPDSRRLITATTNTPARVQDARSGRLLF